MLLSSLCLQENEKLVLYSKVKGDGEADASFVATFFRKMRSWFFILSSEEMEKLMLLSSLCLQENEKLVLYSNAREDEEADASFVASSPEKMKELILLLSPQLWNY